MAPAACMELGPPPQARHRHPPPPPSPRASPLEVTSESFSDDEEEPLSFAAGGASAAGDAVSRVPARAALCRRVRWCCAALAPCPPLHRNGPALVLLVVAWWGCSAWNAVVSKQVLRRGPDDAGRAALLRVAAVSAASNVPGVLGALALRLFGKRWGATRVAADDWGLAACHAFGLYAAYRALVGAKVSSVQAVKALEPLFAMVMSATPFFAGGRQHVQRLRPKTVLPAMVAVAGVIVMRVEDMSYEAEALFWVVASSFLTQGRNQFMKVRQRQQGSAGRTLEDGGRAATGPANGRLSPALQGCLIFIATSASAFCINLVMLLVELALGRGTYSHSLFSFDKATFQILLSGLSHFLYNLASFGVLAFVLPATHSLANTAKRGVTVSASAYFLKEHLTAKARVGLALVIAGSGYYSYVVKSKVQTNGSRDKRVARSEGQRNISSGSA
ncbi:hypothetical protein ACHAWF_017152 [Thalassiosira exigua]